MELRHLAPLALATLAGCSGGKSRSKVVEDARSAPKVADAKAASSLPTVHDYRVDTTVKTGDVQIRVEWKDVPQAFRAPGPATRCGRARVPALAPSTLWGIPDVLVTVDVDHGKAFEPAMSRLVLEDCTFSPRAVVTGPTLQLASALHEPVAVTVQPVARPLAGAAASGPAQTIYLPIAGHAVDIALDPATVYSVALGTDDEAAVVSATTPYVAVTEASGSVVLRDVPVGTHPVRAWLPARNGGEARTAAGTITVTAGQLAEITLDISRP